MDGRGGCCIARYSGAGGYNMSQLDKIMRRFRPIAPKPAPGGSVVATSNPSENGEGACLRSSRRGKRKVARESGKVGGTKRCTNGKRKSSSSDPEDRSVVGGEEVVTLPLLPERKDSLCSGSSSNSNNISDLGMSKRQTQERAIWWNFGSNDVRSQGRSSAASSVDTRVQVMIPQPVRVAGSMVTVECVMETWGDLYGLGRTDEEKIRRLEMDACPGFVSDAVDRVVWTNWAYREMVGQQEETEVRVWLAVKEKVGTAYGRAFSCRVRMQYTRGKERNSLTLPCDVWRMDCGGFAWRLDVKAALSLGL